MAKGKNPSSGKNGRFHITGQIQREQTECQPGELQLAAYVLDRVGTLLGAAAVVAKGNYDVAVRLTERTAVDWGLGPPGAPQPHAHHTAEEGPLRHQTEGATTTPGRGLPFTRALRV